ncbi:MAG: ComF family protein [Chloroflexi bacterium]|nr:ComF family protein [Chloroflexota bacterium]
MSEADLQSDRTLADSPHRASFAFYSGGIKRLLHTTWSVALDLVYPPICVNCQRVGTLLCDYCIEAIEPLPITTPPPNLFSNYFSDYIALGAHTTVLREALHALKYEHEPRLGAVLGRLLAEKVQAEKWQIDIIIPVPLHSQRLAERGYNQSNKIAETLAIEIGSTLASDALDKVRATTSQVELSAAERQHNVEGAFEVAETYQQHLLNKTILLVDDVCTTGSTLIACAEALRKTHVASIFVATVTRAGSTSADSLSGKTIS